jgi:transposase InsO family protein
VIDDFNREALAMDVELSLPAERLVRALDQVIEWRGKPKVIRSDNGPEYIGATQMSWAEKHGIRLEHRPRRHYIGGLPRDLPCGLTHAEYRVLLHPMCAS